MNNSSLRLWQSTNNIMENVRKVSHEQLVQAIAVGNRLQGRGQHQLIRGSNIENLEKDLPLAKIIHYSDCKIGLWCRRNFKNWEPLSIL